MGPEERDSLGMWRLSHTSMGNMAEHQTIPLSGHSKMAMALPEFSFSG